MHFGTLPYIHKIAFLGKRDGQNINGNLYRNADIRSTGPWYIFWMGGGAANTPREWLIVLKLDLVAQFPGALHHLVPGTRYQVPGKCPWKVG